MLPELLRRGFEADIVTDQTSAHDPLNGYVPNTLTSTRRARLRPPIRRATSSAPGAAIAARTAPRWSASRTRAARCSTTATACAPEARLGGFERAFDYPGFVPAYVRPLFCEGRGPFRWVALSGDPADIAATDRAVLEEFPDDEPLGALDRGRPLSRSRSRGCRRGSAGSGYGERARLGLRFNGMVAYGELRGADRDRPRPPRLGLGRLARTARPKRWPTAPTRSPTGRS